MSTLETLNSDNLFKRYISYSVIAHVAVFIFFTIKTVFFTEDPVIFEQAIRVDMVALPDKITAELPPAKTTAAPEKKAEPKPTPPPVAKEKVEAKKESLPKKTVEKDAINLDKSKDKQKEALAKLKQMQALEEIESELQEEAKRKAKEATRTYKGNVLSAGTELTGVNKLQADSYLSDVNRHVKANWALPQYLRNRSYTVSILIRFDSNGNIISRNIVQSSGNAAFDDSVISTIDRSSPVPRPPDKFSKIAEVQGFLFKFSE